MDDLKQAVLAWVNDVREEKGWPTLAELPTGKPRNGNQCVIARALTGELTFECGRFDGHWFKEGHQIEGVNIRFPDYVHEFVVSFDLGEFPDLVTR